MATPVSLPITASIARDQRRGQRAGMDMQNQANQGANLLETQDMIREPGYVIYVYNILEREHWLHQTGFPNFYIPACPKGQKYAHTTLPAFTREMYLKPGSTEYMYKLVDGRRAATSLMNPAAFPGTAWDQQLGTNWRQDDQQGNNLNAFGVFWSLTKPGEETKLDGEIKLFRDRANQTMQMLVQQAELLAAQDDRKNISPLMHFAMDYLGKAAPWHMAMYHMIPCPNCGDMIREGISYHRNAWGDRCIIDAERYAKMVQAQAGQQARADAIASVMAPDPLAQPPAPPASAPASVAAPVATEILSEAPELEKTARERATKAKPKEKPDEPKTQW